MTEAIKLGVLASHPIQYHAPLFRVLAAEVDLQVYFAHRQTAKGQAEAGFSVEFDWDVDLLSGYRCRFLENVAREPGVDAFRCCDTPGIRRELELQPFDAFLVTGWYLKCYWQAVRACRALKVPVMVRGDSQLTTSRSWPRRIMKEALYPLILRQFDACLYVGRRNREYLEHYRVPAQRLHFSPHCVDNERFAAQAGERDRGDIRSALGIPPEDKVVLFVGKFLERKRPMDLVEALAVLAGRGVRAHGLLVGDGPLRPALEAAAAGSGVALTVAGFRNQSELPAMYAAADVLALPSDASETWGLVVNEALACGLPVVVSAAAGCGPDLVLPGHTGEVYETGDIHAMTNALERVLSAPPSRDAIRAVIAQYSPGAAARGVIDAASGLAAHRKARA